MLALALAWASPAHGQAVVTVGEAARILADHDGADTTGYRLSINGTGTPIQLIDAVRENGLVSFDLRVVAVNSAGEAPSDAVTVAVVTPPAPALVACPYVNPQGVLTPKPIGDDSVRGWNVLDATNLVDVQKTYARRKQLESWGLDYQVLAVTDGKSAEFNFDGIPRIYIYAPCTGYRP